MLKRIRKKRGGIFEIILIYKCSYLNNREITAFVNQKA